MPRMRIEIIDDETGEVIRALLFGPPEPDKDAVIGVVLLALLERAKHHVMTPEEKAAQRRSWVVGEMMLEHPEMSREEANAIYDCTVGGI